MRRNEKGYTSIELLIAIVILAIMASILIGGITIIRANCFWTSNKVFVQLQKEHPAASELLITKSERHVWDYSKIAVVENGKIKTYCLDTNIFSDYEILECP
ncbi:MAG: prepilin-type N-terminal cleavage/methylation domain-containing protein [Patescibacteria group bacterium]